MNHLEEAKIRITGKNTMPAYDLSCVTERDVEEAKVHALIAIAESQAKIAHDNASFLLVLDKQLGKIAEQLEKITKGEFQIVEIPQHKRKGMESHKIVFKENK